MWNMTTSHMARIKVITNVISDVEKIDILWFLRKSNVQLVVTKRERPRKEVGLRMWIFDWKKDASWLKAIDGKEYLKYFEVDEYMTLGLCTFWFEQFIQIVTTFTLVQESNHNPLQIIRHINHPSLQTYVCTTHRYFIAPASVYCLIPT